MSGLKAERMTPADTNNQLLYFTSSSLRKDDQVLYYISDRSGHPNVYAQLLATGEEKQLTRNTDGTLKSYVYFHGEDKKGLGKASIALHEESGNLYFIQGQELCCANLEGELRTLATLPDNQVTAFTHVSPDHTRICIPTTDARALEYGKENQLYKAPPYNIDQRVKEERLSSYLRVYDATTGESIETIDVPEAWVTHVQFSPMDSKLILYNHEWSVHSGVRRLWIWDGQLHQQLRQEGDGRSRNDYAVHEMWQDDGKGIIYHGAYHAGSSFIGRLDLTANRISEAAMPSDYTQYGHFTAAHKHPNWLVSDGYYREAESNGAWGGEWLSLQHVDWERGKMEWHPLLKHGSNWDCQDSHPHPIFDHHDQYVYFTSNKEGFRAVYRVDVGDILK